VGRFTLGDYMTVEQAKQIIAAAQVSLPATKVEMDQLRAAIQLLAGAGLKVS